MMEDRIESLEIALAHQQRLVEQLNEVVVEHSQQLLQASRQQLRMESTIKELREQLAAKSAPPPNEKPPHY